MADNSSGLPGYGDVPPLEFCVGMESGLYVWAISSLICCAVGLPASFLILREIFKAYRSGAAFTSSNLFVLNLTSMDGVFLLFLPICIVNQFKFNIWLVDAFSNMMYAFNICGRPLLMACICLDSYVAVVRPIFYRRMKSLTPRAVGVVAVWIVTLITGGLYFCFHTLYFTLFSASFFAAAMVVIGICDAFILRALIAPGRSGKGVHPQKRRAVHVLTNSLALAAVSYVPPVVLFGFGRFLMSDQRRFICTIAVPVAVTSTLGSAIMPVCHLHNLGKFNRLWIRCRK